jgi:hypothetical protein
MIMIIFVTIMTSLNPEAGRTMHQIFCFIFPFYVPQGALFWIATVSQNLFINPFEFNFSLIFQIYCYFSDIKFEKDL